MKVSREDLLHIANLANLEIKEEEVDEYLVNLQDILNFADTINSVNTDELKVTISANEAKNKFRKDEVKIFEDNASLLQNAVEKEQNMFKLPKVIN